MLHAMVHVQRVPQSRSMQVFGFDSSTTSVQVLELYFENVKKSRGGEVESIEDCGNYAIVTFKEKQSENLHIAVSTFIYTFHSDIFLLALERILQGEHEVDGQKLNIMKYFPCLGVAREGSSEDPIAADAAVLPLESNVISVSNISPNEDTNSVKLLFENKRMSGGGPVERVEFVEEGFHVITFTSKQGDNLTFSHD